MLKNCIVINKDRCLLRLDLILNCCLNIQLFQKDIVKDIFIWIFLLERKLCVGSGVVFLVHGTILQQWSSLLKNSVSIEKKILLMTVEQLCQWLLNNHASHCWTIVLETVEQLCQPLLNNHASDSWTIVLVIVEQWCQYCWTIMPVRVQQVNALTIISILKYFSRWAPII